MEDLEKEEILKSYTVKTIKVELDEFEKQVIAAAETKPVDRVCAAFMINEHELNEILKKK
jgi:hypothetical protein